MTEARHAPELLAELQKAHELILLMLNELTPAAKRRFSDKAAAAGLIEDGATRYHERAAVIARAQSSGPGQSTAGGTPMAATTVQPTNNLVEHVMSSERVGAAVYEICALLTNRPPPHDDASRKWDQRVEGVLDRINGGT